MSDIQVNESMILKSTNQFAGKQQIFYKKASLVARKNQLASTNKMQAIMAKMDAQMERLQQFGDRTTQDIEKNCAEFVNLDKNMLTDMEVTG
ncbi:hypothetical protein QJV15_02045 [Listeria cossartiae subsp. cayugensis]|uniref:hypothetical protein n=1 Tax=Listeria TaxID=1637 RepID=UPI001629498D|nr:MULTISPECIES: hypothetical protein [Listeria]MBC1543724.1 hypothetical protein [Listeria cossartiae subsp. cossartiae]MBF2519778.1 hypothetical protein [Listeria marthii]MDS9999653.1 hypothetical protein [Listeria cossartiae subsp. cayugensis]MDT0007900.1 hypothetical protein [Listeria cossartiae subsp. cayugensis]MDT0029685.1 hypothetical protein [Listeria cossartiae subsp. cayugensis]